MPDRMDGYVRVSVVGGRAGERFQSPDQQRDAISAWARANGVQIAAWHEDLDRSGGTMDRPGMNAALKRVAEGRTGGIVVARIDRFARTVIGGLTTIQQLHESGARVVSVAESLDPATPIGRAMLGLLLIMAEWQRDQANEALAAAQQRAASAGRFPGKPSFGYVKDPTGLTIMDPDAAQIVCGIFAARAGGDGWRLIADRLNQAKVPTPLGRDRWAPTTIQGIIRSEAYLGVFVGPRGLRVEDAWPPIVERGLWDAANMIRGVRDDSRGYQDRLFAGLARCRGCRYVMTRAVNAQGFVSYSCPTRGCEQHASIGAALLDSYAGGLIDRRLEGMRARPQPTAGDSEGRRLTAARDRAVRELERWRDDLEARDVLGDADYRAGLLARARARDDAEVDLAAHRTTQDLASLPELPGGRVLTLADMPWPMRRVVVETLVHSVWVSRSQARGPRARRLVAERVRLVWRDDRHPPELPSRTRPHPGPL